MGLGFLPPSDVPTILTIRNIRVATNEHPPPHVHAIGRNGGLAKLELNCPDGPVTLIGQAGFRAADIAEIGMAVAADPPAILPKWRAIHG